MVFFYFFVYRNHSFKNNTSFVSRFNTLRRARSSATHSPAGSKHGPHQSSSNQLQAVDTSADNVSISGHAGDESTSIVSGLDSKVSKKGSDGEHLILSFLLTINAIILNVSIFIKYFQPLHHLSLFFNH